MITGINLNETTDFICKGDIDNPTIWKISAVPSDIMALLSFDSKQTEQIEVMFKFIQIGLKGWSNFNIEFSTKKEKILGEEYDVVPKDILRKIPIANLTEIFTEIIKLSQLSPEERKN